MVTTMGKRYRKWLRSIGAPKPPKRPKINDPFQTPKRSGADWQPTKVNLDKKRAHNRAHRKMRRASRQASR